MFLYRCWLVESDLGGVEVGTCYFDPASSYRLTFRLYGSNPTRQAANRQGLVGFPGQFYLQPYNRALPPFSGFLYLGRTLP